MHSSRMRTARLLTVCLLEGSMLPEGGGVHLDAVNRMTHARENITFPILRMRAVIKYVAKVVPTSGIFDWDVKRVNYTLYAHVFRSGLLTTGFRFMILGFLHQFLKFLSNWLSVLNKQHSVKKRKIFE